MAELHQGAPLSAAQIGVLVEEVEDGREDARVAKALRIIAAAVDFRAHAAAHQAILKLQPQLVKAIADRGAATAARADACLVLKQLADCDKGCRPQLLPGLPQALTSALRTTDARALHIAAMHAYLSSIRDIDASTRAASLEELQRLGGLSDLAACLRVRDDEVNETAARIWGW